jgi:ABC-type nitrate/sulfonate/bicarbonate transport system substrate-binding protein
VQDERVALTGAANGEFDVVLATPSPLMLTTIGGGLDLVMLGATHNAFDLRLVAAADLQTPTDLVGKTAVIFQKGTLNDFQTRDALLRLGLDPDVDLVGTWTGANQAERVEHVRQGNAQAIVVPLPLSRLLAREGLTEFGDLSDGAAWPGVAIVVSRPRHAQRYDYYQRFLKGLLASIQQTKNDPATAQQLLAKYTQIGDAEALQDAYAVYGDRLLERVPYLSAAGLERAIEFTMQTRPPARRPQASALIEHNLLTRLEREGFVDNLYR